MASAAHALKHWNLKFIRYQNIWVDRPDKFAFIEIEHRLPAGLPQHGMSVEQVFEPTNGPLGWCVQQMQHKIPQKFGELSHSYRSRLILVVPPKWKRGCTLVEIQIK
jgi:hypothetical protein